MAYNAEQNQQQNNQDPNNPQTQTLAGSGGAPSNASNSGRVAAFSSGQQAGSTGSGRYTNLQKYIGANQGASDRLYQGINNRIGQTSDPKKKEAETQASAVREGIQQGAQTLERGQGYYNQMQDQNFNAKDFAADQNRLNDYSQFRTGTAVDQNALQTQNTNAQAANMQAQDAYNQRLNQVGTEAGRFDLLKETFGGRNAYRPTYSAGQQRLDQLFLQAGAGNKVGQIQNDLRGNVNALNQNLSGLQGQVTQQIGDLGTQQSALSGNIQNKANQLETGYIGDIQGQVAGVNTARDAERKKYNDFVQQILDTGRGRETSNQLDGNLFNEAQLRAGEQTYNFLKNPTLTSQQFQNIDTRNAADYRDIANQGNVDYYDSLSKLAGINNSKLNAVGQLIDPTTGGLNRAASLKTGEGSLRAGIDNAGEQFWNNAQNAMIQGFGSDAGSSGVFGSGGDAQAMAQIKLADYLKSQGFNPQTAIAKGPESPMGTISGYAANPLGGASLDLLNSMLGGSGSMVGNIAGGLNQLTGGDSGSGKAANYRAQNALLGNLNQYLQDAGYNNYLTTSGVKNTDDLANRQTAVAQDQLDIQTRDRYNILNKDFNEADALNQARTNLANSPTYAYGAQMYNSGILDQNPGANLMDLYQSNPNLAGQIAAAQQYQAAAESQVQGQKNERNRLQTELNEKRGAGQTASNAIQAEMRQRLGLPEINLDTLKGAYYKK